MPRKISITVHTFTSSNGDGSDSVHVYGTQAEAIQHKRDRMRDDLTDEEILEDDDYYENGVIGQEKMNFELDDDGSLRLVGSISFETGNQ